MNIIEDYLPINKHSRPGSKIKPRKIAVHYVGNAGTSAKGNRDYFEGLKVGKKNKNGSYIYASSHYIIGLDGEILKLIPENEISYCTNQANSYTISIECCHPDKTGKFNSKTLNSLIELCADICKRYGFNPLTDIIRHYDVTGKHCPLWWTPNGPNKNANADFLAFKNSVKNKMNNKIEIVEKVEEEEMVSEGKAIVNGKEYKIDRILKDGVNYIKAGNFNNMGFDVGYDKNTKAVKIKNKTTKIKINDTEISTINVDGSNYVNVREIANLLKKDVDFVDNKIVIK